MFNRNLFTSMRLDWKTPKAVYQTLNAEFNFDFDPCPNRHNKNGLEMEWGERNFVNPPYGREITKWVQKSIDQYEKGKIVVLLVASRTDTKWWHLLMEHANQIRFIKGRLKFDGSKKGAPFPSAIVILDHTKEKKNE